MPPIGRIIAALSRSDAGDSMDATDLHQKKCLPLGERYEAIFPIHRFFYLIFFDTWASSDS